MSNTSEQQHGADPIEAIVAAITTVRGVRWDDLELPLYDEIDADALVQLFESSDNAVTVAFRYDGHDVEVRPDLSVAVDGMVVEPRRGR